MFLSEKFYSSLHSEIKFEVTKNFVSFKSDGKKALLFGRRVQLLVYNPDYGPNFIEISDDIAKQKHLGKIRCTGVVYNEYELLLVFSKYFKFEIFNYEITEQIIHKKNKKVEKQIEKKEEKTEQQPNDRDEKELIIEYRKTLNKKEKEKIFNIILFQRGVKGKTWDKIIKNYISYNKYKFSCLYDRNEQDFYQDIVIALHKQVETWFDPTRNICFSTYAWYVINSSFNKTLQLFSSQKRKNPMNNIELNNNEYSWDETISSNNTYLQKTCFEVEFEQRNLYQQIQKLFELKEIQVSEELKQEVLKIIREKSTLQNSIGIISKKYNITINELFILEKDLRENLKNSMYNDIILSMQDDLNYDEEIAKKYKRSKGHIIKMKKQLTSIVRNKLKGIDNLK